ncbi:MAG: GNAT family N-acetyltransferase [Chloroflexi bacterium]|nr:GNAT family N-acetyltransferase [Chloroflexota bacterium]
MYELNRTDFERVRPLFRKMDIHLPLQAILAGNVAASIYVDNPLHPQTAITWTGHRFYLAGSPGNTDLIAAARKIFLEKFAMSAWKSGIDSYHLYYPSDKWEIFIKAMLLQKFPMKSMRSYLAIKANRRDIPEPPEGFSIRPADPVLLSEKWENQEILTEEMCSERESVQDFLDKSFGLCVTKENFIAGWCLSEYNTGHRCEVGIATQEEYQRAGLATLMTEAFIEMARKRDVARIGWHCNATNAGSIATALKAGFEKIEDYPVFIGWFDDTLNIAKNGYFAHGRGEYADALAFYEKSFSLGDVPDWVYWGAACDAALIGETDKALKYLAEAVDHGFDDIEQIQNSKYLVSLHGSKGWELLIEKLA